MYRGVALAVAVAVASPSLGSEDRIQRRGEHVFSNVATEGGYAPYAVPKTVPKAPRLQSARTTPVENPLQSAIFANDVERARQLIADGADVNARDGRGRTPLMSAVWFGRAQMVELLLEHGADVKATTAGGDTALHVAAQGRESTEVTRLLLNAGADVRAVNHAGRTPLHEAVTYGNKSLAASLQAAGASPNATDTTGRAAVPTVANGRPPPAPYVPHAGSEAGHAWGERTAGGTTHHFDRQGSLTKVQSGGRSATIRYRYDRNGNMTRMETPSQVIEYDYDAVDQLTGMHVKDRKP